MHKISSFLNKFDFLLKTIVRNKKIDEKQFHLFGHLTPKCKNNRIIEDKIHFFLDKNRLVVQNNK
jgi:hypothetical protein